jgi:predicted secreted protein
MTEMLETIATRLKDERSRKVLFVSHCLLNENTRYLGGAFTAGIRPEIAAAFTRADYGIVQLPCPEERAWGGILKPLIWLPLGAESTPLGLLCRIFFGFFLWHTRSVFARLASQVAKQVSDYIDSGYTVVGIVGIDGSPTCGVNSTLNLKTSFAFHLGLSLSSLERAGYNQNLYARCAEKGAGLFMSLVEKKLAGKRIKVDLLSVSIHDEMKGNKTVLDIRV